MPKPLDPALATRLSLLDRLRNVDDNEGWQEFVRTYQRLIYSVARRAGLRDDEAAEVVQETLITAARKLPEFIYDPRVGSFRGWLLNTARWRIADQLRRRHRDRVLISPGPGTSRARENPVDRVVDPRGFVLPDVWEEEWREALLQEALEIVRRKVNPKSYQIFDLYALKGWPVASVAETLGVSVRSVYVAKHRVSLQLKRTLRQLKRWAR